MPGLELACGDELAALPAWTDLAKCSTWAELAEVARLRESIASPHFPLAILGRRS
jgi:hypothetical protein